MKVQTKQRSLRVMLGVMAMLSLPQHAAAQSDAKSGDTKPAVKKAGDGKDGVWSFRHHVLPVLSKAGCNSGGCHGAVAGKGGFRLSLDGYAPEQDYHTIVKEMRGRRVELADPGRSLLLAKPTGAIRHKGGLLLKPGTRDYRVLVEWIANGAPPPRDDDAALERIEALPKLKTLSKSEKHGITVKAYYSDGRVEDVTHWARFTSSNETVARVDTHGEVSVIGHGEGAVVAWFSSKLAIARVTVPYENKVDARVFAEAPRRNFIDEHVLAQLKRLNLPPSPPADDATFIRRAYLDATGTLPQADDVRAFLKDESKDKRDKLIDKLLESDTFVDYWTHKWADVLLVNGRRLRPDAVKAYHQWIRGEVKGNTPWDGFARKIVTATGHSLSNGATNFYALHQDPESMSENVSQAFLGLSINCAKCHNHPLEKWTNDQYYAMANLFARVRAKGWGGDSRNGDGKRTLYVATSGELVQPLTGKPQPPTPLDGTPLPFDAAGDRRTHLANWLTSPENPYFAKAVTNRVWANFFAVGLVEDVDDMRLTNPASNDALLTAAADYLIKHRFDLKSLMRAIMRSATYQRSSVPLQGNEAEKRFYTRYYPRRLNAEVLLDAVSQVTAAPSVFNEVVFPGGDRRKTDFYPKGTRAIQLYDSAVNSYFLDAFGRNPRDITCECERSNQPSMIQVLHINNGNTLNGKLQAKGNRVEAILKQGLSDEAIIDAVYLSSLSRFPKAHEKSRLLNLMKPAEPTKPMKPAERRIAVEDLFWAVLSSREFIFNH